jgi:hypothetical protein
MYSIYERSKIKRTLQDIIDKELGLANYSVLRIKKEIH